MKPKRAIFLRKFGRIAGFGLLFVLFSGTVYYLAIAEFTIKNIVVVGNNIRVQVDETRLPKTLLLFPSVTLRTQLLTDNPMLFDIQFRKKYPHTLIIIPTLRTAVVRLVLVTREVFVDDSGIVLADADTGSPVLPRLFLPLPSVRIGETLSDPRVASALSFITGVRDILSITAITVEDERSLRAKSDTVDILFPHDGSMPAIVATLQTLLSGFRIKGTLPTFIDLRFNKPIIKF